MPPPGAEESLARMAGVVLLEPKVSASKKNESDGDDGGAVHHCAPVSMRSPHSRRAEAKLAIPFNLKRAWSGTSFDMGSSGSIRWVVFSRTARRV